MTKEVREKLGLKNRKSREMFWREIAVGMVKMSEPPLPLRSMRY
jgi:hypothetical protein